MPELVQKLHIHAAEDGVVLRDIPTQGRASKTVHITYGSTHLQRVPTNTGSSSQTISLEASGIIGILELGPSSHLIAITGHQQVAQIRDKAVYGVRDVTLVPLSSQQEAEKAITTAWKRLKQDKNPEPIDEDGGTDVEDDAETASSTDNEDTSEAADSKVAESTTSSNSENQAQAKGRYKNFATRWFRKNSKPVDKSSNQTQATVEDGVQSNDAAISDGTLNEDQQRDQGQESTGKPADAENETKDDQKEDESSSKQKSMIESLTPRILRSARLLFSTSGFYFSYEHDISGTLTQKSNLVSDLPLWKRFDAMYFWNRHLIDPFIKADCDDLVLPLMQGFVGQRAFSIAKTDSSESDHVAEAVQQPEEVVAVQDEGDSDKLKPTDESQTKDFLLTLISRRSIKRAGLRYMRRGVDDDGNVANHIETEQVLSTTSWNPSHKTFALLQIRGSIPLHFSQSPYSFKPTSVIFGSESTNQAAFTKHFSSLTRRYGHVQIVSLIDKNPPEVTIGEAFEKYATELKDHGGVNGKDVKFEWFDFHTACKGMNFQNVSILMDAIRDTLGSFGWITKQDDRNTRLQTGVVRTNCMDCLDRTNVVQQAIAEWALEKQLEELGLNINLRDDPKTQWFNTLWADNGDNMSKQYAGTAALKGDFTRNRKRTWTGAMSDFGRTLTRYYNNIFGDYFLQTCIDYLLGNAGPGIFDEFEDDMMSKDYALNMVQIRSNAIDTCVKMVLDEPRENLIGGWTFSCPKEANTLRTFPFEECVILLTRKAFYFCQFDWNTEGVNGFERVDLVDVLEIYRGAYITSTLGASHTDQAKNVGFAVRYKKTERSIVRTGTQSLRGEGKEQERKEDYGQEESGKGQKEHADDGKNKQKEGEKEAENEKDSEETRVLAFKALPPETSATKDAMDDVGSMSEVEMVKRICDEVQKAMMAAMKQRGPDHLELDKIPEVEEKDVISLKDAKKSTGYMESIGYSMKRMVWS